MGAAINFEAFPHIASQAHLENLVRMVIRQNIDPDNLPTSLQGYDPELRANPDLFQAGNHEALQYLKNKPDATPGELYKAIKGRLMDEINENSEYDKQNEHYLRPQFIGTGSEFNLEKSLNESVFGRKVPRKFTAEDRDEEELPVFLTNTKPFTSLDRIFKESHETKRPTGIIEEIMVMWPGPFDLRCQDLRAIWHKKDTRLEYWPYKPPPKESKDFKHIVNWDEINRTEWPNVNDPARLFRKASKYCVKGIDKDILELYWMKRKTFVEIGNILNMHRTTVSNRLNRTVARLRKYFDYQKKMRHLFNFESVILR